MYIFMTKIKLCFLSLYANIDINMIYSEYINQKLS